MTNEKCLEVLDRYERKLRELGAQPIEVNYDDCGVRSDEANLNHLAAMIPKMREFIHEAREGKFFRWLGFMQGAFLVLGVYSLNEMRNHNGSLE